MLFFFLWNDVKVFVNEKKKFVLICERISSEHSSKHHHTQFTFIFQYRNCIIRRRRDAVVIIISRECEWTARACANSINAPAVCWSVFHFFVRINRVCTIFFLLFCSWSLYDFVMNGSSRCWAYNGRAGILFAVLVLVVYGGGRLVVHSEAAIVPPPWSDPSNNPCAALPGGWQLLYWAPLRKCFKIFTVRDGIIYF